MSDWHEVTATEPCELCGGTHWCARNGTAFTCRKQSEHPTLGRGVERTDKSGGTFWLFRCADRDRRPSSPVATLKPVPERADPDLLHNVYSSLLKRLPWEIAAQRELHRRGLTPQQVQEFRVQLRYGYLPERGRAKIANEIIAEFGEAAIVSVPGFVVREHDGRRYWTIAGRAGLLIPIRDVQGRIIALVCRPDDPQPGKKYVYLTSKGKAGGAGPGAPVHVPRFDGDRSTVRVTEGALKADVATMLSGVLTIALPGVATWKAAAPVLVELDAKRVLVALDADWRTNPAVATAVESLTYSLGERGLDVAIETWPVDSGKGIDDLLLSGGKSEALEGPGVGAVLTEIAAVVHKPNEPVAGATVAEADDDPHRLARLCLSQLTTIRFFQDEFYQYAGPSYCVCATAELRAAVTAIIKVEFDRLAKIAQQMHDAESEKAPPKPKKVSKALTSEVLDKMAALRIVPYVTVLPAWLGDDEFRWNAGECLVTTTGILPVPSLNSTPTLIEPTPDLFTVNSLDFAFDPAAKCPQWTEFLLQLWPDDPQSISTLQEIIGYLLLPTTRQQKMFMLIGPKRSGKGTIARIIKHVVGPANVCAPTLGSLSGDFGLQPLLHKTVAIIGDARLSGRQDSAVVVERILSITGEDAQTINRKHMTAVTVGCLPVRFLLLSNELPKLSDASATLPSRMILLRLAESFYGREDHGLTDRLLTELPGILCWALRGWQRLHKRGHFVQPESSADLLDDLESLSSPIMGFVKERCTVAPGWQISVKTLFVSWKEWCELKGRKSGSEQSFGRDIRAAVPSIRVTQPRDELTESRFGTTKASESAFDTQ